MPYLEVTSEQGRKRLTLDGSPVTVGRFPDNAVVITDDRASRHHCVFEPSTDGWRIRDLESRNGTKLNEERVTEQLLNNGDVVRIGRVVFRFIDPDQTSQRRARERNVPDFATAEATASANDVLRQETLDLDLNEAVTDVRTDYEARLREIIDSAPEKPFEDTDISLVDSSGQVVHQATGAGLDSGRGNGEVGEGIRVFRLLLLACFRARATDLHVEPKTEDAQIRLRVDGYMLSAVQLRLDIYKRLLGIIKILCQIDTTKRNSVQDGHFSATVKGRRVDYRVSLTPAMHGQKLVIRVLDTANAPTRLHELGTAPWMYEKMRAMSTKDAGMILACGPTGSGKTTTLYSCLREVDLAQRNVITIEDPVEYSMEGCTQIPVNAEQGNSFAQILRSVLRQDPDVIFVGEVRDIETANVAMQAAMTGHLVLSTVHSKDSIGAIFRLLDLGVESYLVANALNLIIAQRLVRTLCEVCRKPVQPTPAQTMRMGKSLSGLPHIFVPVGCRKCLRTGYTGRQAIFELLEVTDPMRDVILKSPTIQGIRAIAEQGLFTRLQQSGFALVRDGMTSLDEVERVSGSDG